MFSKWFICVENNINEMFINLYDKVLSGCLLVNRNVFYYEFFIDFKILKYFAWDYKFINLNGYVYLSLYGV